MQYSKRHHLVPRFYLRYFADQREQVRQTWLPGDRSHLSNIANVSVKNDFYSVQFDEDGVDTLSDFWEQTFSQIEGDASAAFAHVIDEQLWPLRAKDRESLAVWIALQRLRTSAIRDQQAEVQSTYYRLIAGINGIAKLRVVMEDALGRPVGDLELEAEWDDLTRPEGPNVRGDAAAHIDAIRRLIGPTVDLLLGSGMSIWRFDRKKLVTSDSPVVLLGEPGPAGGGIGIATSDFMAVALSRFVGLAADTSGGKDRTMAGTTNLARTFNGIVSAEARRWVISHPEDDIQALHLQLGAPRVRELGPVALNDFLNRDRPLESVVDSTSGGPNSIPLSYPEWPLPGRTFINPHSP